MIIGIIHKGSGCGDQLFSYIATCVRAADLGVDFGFVGKEFFKGASFMDLNWGKKVDYAFEVESDSGKVVIPFIKEPLYELNTPYYNPEFNFIPDGSVIDGYGAQDIRYFEHRLDEVREWLKVEPLEVENKCVVNFRGGEYASVPDLFLPLNYWREAIMEINPLFNDLNLEFHTDDPVMIKEFFKNDFIFNPIKDIGLNWRSIRYAKNAIISNSAFAIIPRLLKHLEDPEAVTIAPKYWAGRNVGEWRRPGNYYREFLYK